MEQDYRQLIRKVVGNNVPPRKLKSLTDRVTELYLVFEKCGLSMTDFTTHDLYNGIIDADIDRINKKQPELPF